MRPPSRPLARATALLGAIVVASSLVVSVPSLNPPAGASPAASGAATAATEYYAVPPSGVWTVNGAGWGHGIGMSQWGAQGAALQGASFSQILGFYYPGTSLGWVANPHIRVQLTSMSGGGIVFGRVGSEQLTAQDLATGQTQVLPPASRYVLSIDANGMYLGQWTDQGWSSILFNGSAGVAGPVEITGPSGTWAYNPNLSGAGTQYRGAMRMVRTSSTTAQAVNVLLLDDYLRGVVPRESPSWWHAEALRAQAVAARSYALAVSSPTGSWDLCDTTQCQVYGGRTSIASDGTVTHLEPASTSAAVDTTSGIVVAYGNAPAFTQFSSSNGGFSVAGSRPYLVAQADPYSGSAPTDPVSRWQAQLPASRLQAECPAGGTLSSFQITGRDGKGPFGGRITALQVNCTTGSRTITSLSALSFGMRSRMWLPDAPTGNNPTGSWEGATASGSNLRLQGWALDPDTTSPIEVHVYIDGGGINLGPATLSRPDVEAAFPGYGAQHGFDTTVGVANGTHNVCVYAINVGAGAHTLLGCRQVVVNNNPLGNWELGAAGPSPSRISVSGWAFDPDTSSPIDIHAYVDGGGINLGPADRPRADVAQAFPQPGGQHGFSASIYTGPGPHDVCLYAINTGPGSHTLLGCRQIMVSGVPIGNLELVSPGQGSVRVAGWTLDPDTAAPIDVHVYVDAVGTNLGPAAIARPDVGGAYPDFGSSHGFDSLVTAASGVHDVCVYAYNVGYGSHTQLGCRRVTVG